MYFVPFSSDHDADVWVFISLSAQNTTEEHVKLKMVETLRVYLLQRNLLDYTVTVGTCSELQFRLCVSYPSNYFKCHNCSLCRKQRAYKRKVSNVIRSENIGNFFAS